MIMRTNKILLLIFLAVFAFRLLFVFQSQEFSDDSAYFHLRHATYIKEHLKPMSYDELSFSGRDVDYPPLFHYFLAMFLFLPIMIKIIPEFLISLLVFVVYAISKELVKQKENKETSSLTAAFLSGFIPIIFDGTLNKISVYSLTLPLIFFGIYCMMKMREKRQYIIFFVILSFVLPLSHPSALILIPAFLVYFLLVLSESWKIRRLNKEAIFLYIFLAGVIEFLIYGRRFIFPEQLAVVDLSFVVNNIGIFPVLLGFFGVFLGSYKEKSDSFYLLCSFLLSVFLLMLVELVPFKIGLVFLSITLAIFSAITVSTILGYIMKTKFSRFYKPLLYILFIFLIFTTIAPAIESAIVVIEAVPSDWDIEALEWMKTNSEAENKVVLTTVNDANFVMYKTGAKTIADNSLYDRERFTDLRTLYSIKTRFKAIELLNKYGVEYLFLSEKAKMDYNINDFGYSDEERCFNKVKYKEPKIYKFRCLK